MAEEAYIGVTKPMSLEPPSKRDGELNDLLMTELKAQKNFESPEESKRREDVLRKLHKLTQQLVQVVGKEKGLPKAILDTAGGKVFTYGSYRLGVYGPGSDIDTLVVVPKHVTREHFFKHFPELLRSTMSASDITEMTPVPDASVPIIKLELCGISVDLIFSNLQVSSVPSSLELTDNNLLRGLNDIDLRCVNGTRVTDRILQLVPQSRVFRIALRAVKLWAQRRAIYGNVVGFPGGVAYAMMVARTCQLYPKAAAPRIVQRFFWLIRNWNWPSPVLLQSREDAPLQLREWDPSTSFHDRKHLMPIITPAYPSMNSTHNIGPSTMAVLMKELLRAQGITDDIYDGRKEWKDLFFRHTFFSQDYKHYITIVSASRSKEAQQAWSGLCQARLRRLISKIEELSDSVELAHPFNKGFDRVHACKTEADVDKTLQGSLEFQVKEVPTETTDEAGDIKVQAAAEAESAGLPAPATNGTKAETRPDGTQIIYTTTYYVGIQLAANAKSLDMSYATQDYRNVVTGSDLYSESMHSVRVIHVRNYDLPDDVFAEGETRPTRSKKAKVNKTASQAPANTTNKRTVADAGLTLKDLCYGSSIDLRDQALEYGTMGDSKLPAELILSPSATKATSSGCALTLTDDDQVATTIRTSSHETISNTAVAAASYPRSSSQPGSHYNEDIFTEAYGFRQS
ncbi:hypothetical protein AMS68_001792 [Peltaster fructicola]|uniref:Poly(A) polymerase n=1 Tax=Peltaster fructicola TaxID=286661 RepID=A0A6H0XNR3_9PEZI|nr:hypothetical protein AMS68_001792 [Peltaster fructicola]